MKRLLFALLMLSGCAKPHAASSWIHSGASAEAQCELFYVSDPAAIKTLLARPEGEEGASGVTVLETGTDSLNARAWLSQHAQKSIDVQYFIFASDNLGLVAIDYLVRAAERGVKVRLLVDDTNVHGDAQLLLAAAKSSPNLSIHIYNPNMNIGKAFDEIAANALTDFKGINQRMHNKSFTVDSAVTITGGRNVADEYFDHNRTYNFRDRDLLLTGAVVADVDASFEAFWTSDLSVSIESLLETSPEFVGVPFAANLHAYSCDETHFWSVVRTEIAQFPVAIEDRYADEQFIWTDRVSFFSDAPGKNENDSMWGGGASTDQLIELVKSAKKRLVVQTPYLIVSELGLSLFGALEQRGVEVVFLTNSLAATDGIASFHGYKRHRKQILDLGVEIYEVKPRAEIRNQLIISPLMQKLPEVPDMGLHAKTMVIDSEVLVVSSFNLDPRSANLNTELATVVHHAGLAQMVEDLIVEEMAPENAWHTTYDFNPDKEAPFGRRFKMFWAAFVPLSLL